MPKNDLAYQKVSFDLGYYKSVSSGSGTSGEADKAGVSEPIKMKVAETPARGSPPTRVILQRVSAGALSGETRAPVRLFSSESCSSGHRLPGAGQSISAQQTQSPRNVDLQGHCDSQLMPGTAFDLCPFQRRQPSSGLSAPRWILKTQALKNASPCQLIESQIQLGKHIFVVELPA